MSFNPLRGLFSGPPRSKIPRGTVGSIATSNTALETTTGTPGLTVRRFPGGPKVFRPNATLTGRKAVTRGSNAAAGGSNDFDAAQLAAQRQRQKSQTAGRQGNIRAGFKTGAPKTKPATLTGR